MWNLLLTAALVLAVLAGIWLTGHRARRIGGRRIADPASRRMTLQGEVAGFRDRYGLHVWLGIPYAAPPVGELRWRAPRPAKPWSGTREALHFGPKPVQIAGLGGAFPRRMHGQPAGDEDCLYVNLWAPFFTPENVPRASARLPVMVWIYGGANSVGAANVPTYNLGYLANQHRILLVSFNYRLGLMGWFRHPALYDENATEEDRSGNYGTLDILHTLRWVRENISAFGGDPNNVTIFGESAGGTNVVTMLLSPLARGLFHRAIVQSCVLTPYTVAESENYLDSEQPGHRNSAREVINLLLIQDGRATERKHAKSIQDEMDHQTIRDYLYQKSPDELLAILHDEMVGVYLSPHPIADGVVLPVAPWHDHLADPSRISSVPTIFGSNRDEWKTIMCANTDEYVDLRLGSLPRIREQRRWEREARYYSDMFTAAGVNEPARQLCLASSASVFAYRFDWDEWPRLPGLDLPVMIGAGHGIELFFLFGTMAERPMLRWLFGRRRFAAIAELTRAIGSYWVQFARTGDPGRGVADDLPEWGPWTNDATPDGSFFVFDTPASGGMHQSKNVLTVEGIKKHMLSDPELGNSEDELMRLYARLFLYGPFDSYWDRQPFAGLAEFGPGGSKRDLLERYQPVRQHR